MAKAFMRDPKQVDKYKNRQENASDFNAFLESEVNFNQSSESNNLPSNNVSSFDIPMSQVSGFARKPTSTTKPKKNETFDVSSLGGSKKLLFSFLNFCKINQTFLVLSISNSIGFMRKPLQDSPTPSSNFEGMQMQVPGFVPNCPDSTTPRNNKDNLDFDVSSIGGK